MLFWTLACYSPGARLSILSHTFSGTLARSPITREFWSSKARFLSIQIINGIDINGSRYGASDVLVPDTEEVGSAGVSSKSNGGITPGLMYSY